MRKSRYQLWSGTHYGHRVWGINDSKLYPPGVYNISGKGYYSRKKAQTRLKELRKAEGKEK